MVTTLLCEAIGYMYIYRSTQELYLFLFNFALTSHIFLLFTSCKTHIFLLQMANVTSTNESSRHRLKPNGVQSYEKYVRIFDRQILNCYVLYISRHR